MDHFLYSHDLKMIQGWYCKEKLDAGHSWGSKGFYKMVQKLSWICSQKWIVFVEETVNSKEQIMYVGVNIWACFLPNEDYCVYHSSNTYSDVLNKMFINCFWFEWILTIKSTFLYEQKMEEKKNKLKTCHHKGSIQSPFTWEKNRYPLCQDCRA